jgi:hypothetical protein
VKLKGEEGGREEEEEAGEEAAAVAAERLRMLMGASGGMAHVPVEKEKEVGGVVLPVVLWTRPAREVAREVPLRAPPSERRLTMGTAYVLTLVASTPAAPRALKLPRESATAARRRAPRAAPLGLALVELDETGRAKRDAGRPGKEAVVSSLYEGHVPTTTGPGEDELPEDRPRRPPTRPPIRTIKNAAATTRAHLREDQEEQQQKKKKKPPFLLFFFFSSSSSFTSAFSPFASAAAVVADALRGFSTRKEEAEEEEEGGSAERGGGGGGGGGPASS